MSTRMFFARGSLPLLVLAVVSSCGGGGGGGGARGGGNVRTLAFPAGIRGGSPRFSHDGTLLAYVRYDGTTYAVAVMSVTDSDSRTLATDGNFLTGMAWAPDDSEIFYCSNTGIRAVQLAGRTSRFIVDGSDATDPDLSPDGNWLVYEKNGANMQLVDLRLTMPVENNLGINGFSPHFSPDGSTIVYWADAPNIEELNLATQEVTHILGSDILDQELGGVDWFSDGRRLIVGTDRGIELVVLGTPVERTLLLDQSALLDVDLSPDDKSVAYGVNGQAPLYVLTGF